jgi:hypothetical protein
VYRRVARRTSCLYLHDAFFMVILLTHPAFGGSSCCPCGEIARCTGTAQVSLHNIEMVGHYCQVAWKAVLLMTPYSGLKLNSSAVPMEHLRDQRRTWTVYSEFIIVLGTCFPLGVCVYLSERWRLWWMVLPVSWMYYDRWTHSQRHP